MANITITVQSLINTSVYNSYTIDNGQTINQLKTAINTARGFDSTWYDIVLNQSVAAGSATLVSLGIVTGTQLRTHSKISRLATKELKQKAKLDLAALDRAASGEARTIVDITELPTQYSDNSIINNPNPGGLIQGRPWMTGTPFTFYEAFGTTTALATTQYVSGNKIYVYSSTFDVPSYQNAVVIVNDIEVLNIGDRGHNMVVLNSYGDVVSIANYDTYGVAGDLTALASALNGVASGNIVVLTVWDASALNAAVRSAINTGYGSTNSNTWTAERIDHIFIGIKT
jgi:hypothetical protein